MNSADNLHMKNPKALTKKEKIVKVSVLSHGKRCETRSGNQFGSRNCINTPSSQASKPYRNRTSPTTLATRIFLSKKLFMHYHETGIIIKLTRALLLISKRLTLNWEKEQTDAYNDAYAHQHPQNDGHIPNS